MSEDTIKKALKTLEDSLYAKLSANPDFKLWERTRSELARYSSESSGAGGSSGTFFTRGGGSGAGGTIATFHLPFASKSAQVRQFAVKYLEAKKQRATSGEIAKAAVDAGLGPMLGDDAASSRVSAYLSEAKGVFDNVPPHGYGLVAWHGIKVLTE